MDIVVDTNVFINGIFKSDEFCKAIFKLKATNNVTFVMSKEMRDELLVTFATILLEVYETKKDKLGVKEMKDIDQLFDKTLALVKECGKILKTAIKEEKESKIKEDGSIVTKYDLMIDKKLSQELKEIANCSVLSEEHVEELGNTYFVIDPIDGTHNFEMKWEFFGIMVSYVLEKETMFSIIYLPMLNIICNAIKGKGAYLNGKRVYTKKITNRLVGGCPVTKNNLESISKILNSKENVELRSLFCMAAEQTYVTSGIFDFAFSKNTGSIWDFVATELMIKEAGGIMKLKKLENGKYNAIYGSKEAVEKIENIINIL